MWISILKPEITGKQSKKIPKYTNNNSLLKTKRILNIQI